MRNLNLIYNQRLNEMTKGQFLQIIKDVPMSSEIHVFDTELGQHREYQVEVDQDYNFEEQINDITINVV